MALKPFPSRSGWALNPRPFGESSSLTGLLPLNQHWFIHINGLNIFVVIKYFFGVPHLSTCIFLFFYNEPELGVGIDPGMALTPLPSSIGRGLNPWPSDCEPSALPLDHGFRLTYLLLTSLTSVSTFFLAFRYWLFMLLTLVGVKISNIRMLNSEVKCFFFCNQEPILHYFDFSCFSIFALKLESNWKKCVYFEMTKFIREKHKFVLVELAPDITISIYLVAKYLTRFNSLLTLKWKKKIFFYYFQNNSYVLQSSI